MLDDELVSLFWLSLWVHRVLLLVWCCGMLLGRVVAIVVVVVVVLRLVG